MIGKHVPIPVSISSNLIEQRIFLCKSDPRAVVGSFVDALDGLASQSKTQTKLNVLEIETSVNSKLNQFFSALGRHRCRKEPVLEIEDEGIEEEDERDLSTQFLQTQKSQLLDLQDDVEIFCNVFLVVGFNSAKYVMNLIKSYLLPLLAN